MKMNVVNNDELSYDHEFYQEGVEILRDLNRTWKECLVEYEGEMWHIHHIKNYDGVVAALITCVTKPSRHNRVIDFSHPLLNRQYPKLGYFNYKHLALYFSRQINRQWKQGYHGNTLSIGTPFSQELSNTFGDNVWVILGLDDLARYPMSKVRKKVNVYNHKYPTYSTALSSILNGSTCLSIALSRDVALALHPANGEVHILYHNTPVGVMDLSNPNPLVLKPEFFWLRDTIEELITL